MLTSLSGPLADAVLQETRLRLLAVLGSTECRSRGGFTLQELGARLSCTPQNIHHHLKVLERSGVARVARTEATQRIPRQFWVSEIHGVRLQAVAGKDFPVDVALPPRLGRLVEDLVEAWTGDHGHEQMVPILTTFCSLFLGMDPPAARDLVERLARLVAEAPAQDGP